MIKGKITRGALPDQKTLSDSKASSALLYHYKLATIFWTTLLVSFTRRSVECLNAWWWSPLSHAPHFIAWGRQGVHVDEVEAVWQVGGIGRPSPTPPCHPTAMDGPWRRLCSRYISCHGPKVDWMIGLASRVYDNVPNDPRTLTVHSWIKPTLPKHGWSSWTCHLTFHVDKWCGRGVVESLDMWAHRPTWQVGPQAPTTSHFPALLHIWPFWYFFHAYK